MTSPLSEHPDPAALRRDPAPPPLPDHAYCLKCSYQVRGLTSDRCPECGHSLDALRAAEPQIPWVHRRKKRRFAAYWKTVEFVIFRRRTFYAEMIRPVSLADAQRFRLITCLLAWIPFLFVMPVLAGVDFDSYSEVVDWAGWPTLIVAHIGVLLALFAATGIPSYFFHPHSLPVELQNRAIVLSHYACAPLGLLPFAATPLLVFLQSKALINWVARDDFLGLLGILLAPGVILSWWAVTLQLAECLTHSKTRGLVMLLVWPVLTLIGAIMLIVVLPATVWYACLLIGEFILGG